MHNGKPFLVNPGRKVKYSDRVVVELVDDGRQWSVGQLVGDLQAQTVEALTLACYDLVRNRFGGAGVRAPDVRPVD